MSNSTHKVEVVPVTLEKHPDADLLSIVKICDYFYVANTEQWNDVKLAAYIPPDSLVDTRRPEFSFLAKDAKFDENSNLVPNGPYARIKAKKIRGIISYGLLTPLPPTAEVGSDVAEELGVKHYEPPLPAEIKQKDRFMMGGEVDRGPGLYSPKYDVDAFLKYAKVFKKGEPCFVSEKLNGANSRYVYHDGKIYCGSRDQWKREYARIPVPKKEDIVEKVKDEDHWQEKYKSPEEYADYIIDRINYKNANPLQNVWWKAFRTTPGLEDWLKDHPDMILYGELIGQVKSMKYGCKPGEVKLAFFDILEGTQWLSPCEARRLGAGLPWVPTIHACFQFNLEQAKSFAEGKTLCDANHIREGCVIGPLVERTDPKLGRVKLKLVNHKYLEKEFEFEDLCE